MAAQHPFSVEQLYKAAHEGTSQDKFFLADLLEQGKDVQQNDKEAVRWYFEAAHLGHQDAQYRIAMRYIEGKGLVRDYQEAQRWLQLASTEAKYLDSQVRKASTDEEFNIIEASVDYEEVSYLHEDIMLDTGETTVVSPRTARIFAQSHITVEEEPVGPPPMISHSIVFKPSRRDASPP